MSEVPTTQFLKVAFLKMFFEKRRRDSLKTGKVFRSSIGKVFISHIFTWGGIWNGLPSNSNMRKNERNLDLELKS